MSETTNSNNRSTVIGIIFIILGAIFLLDNFMILPYHFFDYFFNWKGILIAIGTVIVLSSDNKTPGYIMLAIGGFFIMSNLFYYELGFRFFHAGKLFWPVIIIGIGVMILLRKDRIIGQKKRPIDSDSRDMINVTAILGGGNVSMRSNNFQGGKVTAFMGGGDYDLSSCQLAEGTHEIDVFCMFGGASFIVPSDWNVRIEVTSIFGGFTDSRKLQSSVTHADRELVIRGTVIFGGGEIKNYT